MVLRAVCNHLRAVHVLRPPVVASGAHMSRGSSSPAAPDTSGASSPHGPPRRDGTSRLSVRRTSTCATPPPSPGSSAGCDRTPSSTPRMSATDRLRAVNVDGSAAVAAAAGEARLVHVSSDVVFDGRLGRPYREDDVVSPITEYGRTKADAEQVVLRAAPKALVVRTSLIYGGPGRPASPHETAARRPRRHVLHRRAAQPGPGRRSRRRARRAVPPRRRRDPPRRRRRGSRATGSPS